jgi:hypothetical protein
VAECNIPEAEYQLHHFENMKTGKRPWEKAVAQYVNIPSQYSPRQDKKTHDKSHLASAVIPPRSKGNLLDIYRYKEFSVRSILRYITYDGPT